MSAKIIVLNKKRGLPKVTVTEAMDLFEWVGYKTVGGYTRILVFLGRNGSYAFVGKGDERPSFEGTTKRNAILEALKAGREVISAATLSDLEQALFSTKWQKDPQ